MIKKEMEFDLRILESNLSRGLVNEDDYQKYLKSLPDEATKADYLEITEEKDISEEDTQQEGELTFSPAETAS